jgi:hypothetical protein
MNWAKRTCIVIACAVLICTVSYRACLQETTAVTQRHTSCKDLHNKEVLLRDSQGAIQLIRMTNLMGISATMLQEVLRRVNVADLSIYSTPWCVQEALISYSANKPIDM